MTHKNRVIISGGTGLIGTALQNCLRSADFDFRTFVRYNTRLAGGTIHWDPQNPEKALDDVSELEGFDAAVHLSGANLSSHRWTPAYKKTILDSRVDSSRALVNIFSRLSAPPRVLVCASAVGIYGDRGDELLTEASQPGHGYLPEVCKAWEAVPEAARQLGIRVVHLRFGVVLASQGGALKMLLPLFKAGLGARLGNGRQWTSWIMLDDVVRAILYALRQDRMDGAYNAVAPQPVTNREFTAALGKAVHRPAPWVVPAFALKMAMGQMAEDTLLASTRAIPQRLEAAGFVFASPALAPALAGILA